MGDKPNKWQTQNGNKSKYVTNPVRETINTLNCLLWPIGFVAIIVFFRVGHLLGLLPISMLDLLHKYIFKNNQQGQKILIKRYKQNLSTLIEMTNRMFSGGRRCCGRELLALLTPLSHSIAGCRAHVLRPMKLGVYSKTRCLLGVNKHGFIGKCFHFAAVFTT